MEDVTKNDENKTDEERHTKQEQILLVLIRRRDHLLYYGYHYEFSFQC